MPLPFPAYDPEIDEPISLGDAAQLYGISYDTLATAARQGRLDAPRHGQRGRRTTRRAVEMALASGAVRPGQRGPRPKRGAPE